MVPDGNLWIDGDTTDAEVAFQLELRDFGDEPTGELRFAAPRFPLAALEGPFRLGPWVEGGLFEDVAGRLEITEGGNRLTLDLRSGSSRLLGTQPPVELPGAVIVARATLDPDSGSYAIDAAPELPGIRTASIEGRIDASSGRPIEGRAVLEGVELHTVGAFLSVLPTNLAFEATADVTLESDDPERIRYRFAAELSRLDLRAEDGSLSAGPGTVAAEGTVELPIDGPGRLHFDIDATVGATVLDTGPVVGRIERSAVVGTGSVGLDVRQLDFEGRATLPAGAVRVDGHAVPPSAFPLALEGGVSADLGERAAIEGRIEARGDLVGELVAEGRAGVGDPASPIDVAWSWNPADLRTLLDAVREVAAIRLDPWHLDSHVAAAGRLTGTRQAPAVDARVEWRELRAVRDDVTLGEGSGHTRVRWSAGQPLVAEPIELAAVIEVGSLEPTAVRFSGRGELDPAAGRAAFAVRNLEEPELAAAERLSRLTTGVTVEGSWERASNAPLEARVEIDGVPLDELRGYLRPLVGALLPEYELKGSSRLALNVELDPHGAWALDGSAVTEELGLSGRDGGRVLQGLDPTWQLTGRGAPGQPVRLAADAELGGFLVLWGALFGDYSEFVGSVSVEATTDDDRRWSGKADLSVGETLSARAALTDRGDDTLGYELRLEAARLDRAFDDWVRGPLADSIGVLDRLDAGGAARLQVAGELASGSGTIRGELALDRARLEGIEGRVFVRDVELDLPIDLGWRRGPDEALEVLPGAPTEGRFGFGRLALGGVEFARTSTVLEVDGDAVALEGELTLPFLGGTLALENLTLAELLRPGRHLQTGLRLDAIRMDELSRAAGILPLDGTARGRFASVRLSEHELIVEGGGAIDLFGGRIVVGDISGEDVLSRFPELRFSASFEEIDLAQVTDTFDFGRMTGTLEGRIDDCELFAWMPVRFRAHVETVRRKGVPQKITVEAIDNLTFLGTGGRTNAFHRGFLKFLRKYNYEKLGVEMTLARDVLLMKGTEKRGNRELFLKGRFPFRLDVVNAGPGHPVSFSTMLRRVQNLDISLSPPEDR